MKIAFPTRDSESISRHFGKMTAMVVIDLDEGVEIGREVRDMTAMPACGGGGGDHTRPDFVVSIVKDCDVVVANGIGEPLVQRMRGEGVEVVLTRTHTIDGAVAAYLDGTIRHEPSLAHPPRH